MTWASYGRLRVPARCRVYRVKGEGVRVQIFSLKGSCKV